MAELPIFRLKAGSIPALRIAGRLHRQIYQILQNGNPTCKW